MMRQWSTDPNARRLSEAEKQQFHSDGYVKNLPLFDAQAVSELQVMFRDMAERMPDGVDISRVNNWHKCSPTAFSISRVPQLLDYVQDLLGPNFFQWGAQFFVKFPHDDAVVPWHQDAIYWPITPTRTVTVWLAIDDADPGNANMRFIPGSHVHGPIDYEVIDATDTVLNLETQNPESYGDSPVDVTLKAGQFSMHCDLLLHGSEANESDRRRSGITLRYAAAGVKAFHGWHHKGIVVRGEDVDGNWANPPCPPD